MIDPISLTTVIGLALALLLLFFKWLFGKNDERKKTKDDIDKEIDKASDSTSFLRIFDKLRGK